MKEIRKVFINTLGILLFVIGGLNSAFAQDSNNNVIALPTFKLEGPSALEAMERIGETKNLSQRPVDMEVVSKLLWAAHGVTYSGGDFTTHGLDGVSGATLNADTRYTYPLAWYRKFLKLYYMSTEGIYEYDMDNHKLNKLSDKNLMTEMGGTVANAAGRIFVAIDKKEHTDPEKWAFLNIGMLAQNIYLTCASNNLLTASQGIFSKDTIDNELNLPENIKLVYMISFGYLR